MDLVRDWNHARWFFFKISKISGGSQRPGPFSAADEAFQSCLVRAKNTGCCLSYNTNGGQKVHTIFFDAKVLHTRKKLRVSTPGLSNPSQLGLTHVTGPGAIFGIIALARSVVARKCLFFRNYRFIFRAATPLFTNPHDPVPLPQ
jgi:hypothetical protein